MSKHYILFWDDQQILWLDDIIREIHEIDSSIIITIENPDNMSFENESLKRLYSSCQWEFNTEANAYIPHNYPNFAKDDECLQIIFNIYHSCKIDGILPQKFDFALLDAYYEELNDYEYGINHIAKELLGKVHNLPIVIATQLPQHFDKKTILGNGNSRILCFLSKDDLTQDSFPALRQTVAGMIVATITAREYENKVKILSEQNKELIFHNQFLYPEFYTMLSKDIYGIDDKIEQIRNMLIPYFEYLKGDYDNLPDYLKSDFPSSLMFVGHPGTGKSELCDLIVSFLKFYASKYNQETKVIELSPISDEDGPGPKKTEDSCLKKAGELLADAINNARTQNSLVIIRLDDVQLSYPCDVSDGALQNFWRSYLFLIRDIIAYSSACNNQTKYNNTKRKGGIPGFASLGLNNNTPKDFKGKILWLISRNLDDEVGPIFTPLSSVLPRISIEFPKDKINRKKIVSSKISKVGFEIADETLDYFIEQTINYEPRELIGDKKNGVLGALGKIITYERALAKEEWKRTGSVRNSKCISMETVNYILSDIDPLPSHDTEDTRSIGSTGDIKDQSWYSCIDKELLLSIITALISGTKYDHNPDNILAEHGARYLRAVLALIRHATNQISDRQEGNRKFDDIFGFHKSPRKSVGLPQYLQNISKSGKYKDVFVVIDDQAGGFTSQQVKKDGFELAKKGFVLSSDELK